jgi:hypothetical protein
MRWQLEFYHARSGALAHYDLDAASPDAAVAAGRRAVLIEHPPPGGRKRRPSLLARAERATGHDDSGWVLYRIHGNDGHGSAGGAPPAPTPVAR